jgi:DtxR family transcriptional regulator, Mn-dependent transcriptional regulator
LKIQESAENYLETILILSQRGEGVHAVDIANELGFTKASISIAMKRLRENGYIEVGADGHITLTESGLKIAENMYARHQLLTDWLISIGVFPEAAASDACRIEHVISQESFERLREYVKNAAQRQSSLTACVPDPVKHYK